VDGEAKAVVFTVTVRFKLRDRADEAIEAGGDIAPPKLLKRVEPVYPEAARKDGIQGTVILYVTTDEEGRVTQVKVLKSIPALDKAAIDAVRQWQYEPYIEAGKPKPVSFSVTVSFKLR
jgi:TonB family protein